MKVEETRKIAFCCPLHGDLQDNVKYVSANIGSKRLVNVAIMYCHECEEYYTPFTNLLALAKLEYEGKQISSDYLEYMHENKTGALIKAPVKIGAMLAGAPKEDINKLEKYAEKIGLAFQIKDDILSEIGNAEELGKPVGNDRERGKCTYVTKYGLENAQKMLDTIINEAIEIIKSYDKNSDFLIELALYIKNRNK